MADLIAAGLHVGCRVFRRPATPEICGHDMEVPDSTLKDTRRLSNGNSDAVTSLVTDAIIFTPGAVISGYKKICTKIQRYEITFQTLKIGFAYYIKPTLIIACVINSGPLEENEAMTADGLIPISVLAWVMEATGVLVSFTIQKLNIQPISFSFCHRIDESPYLVELKY